MRFWPWGAIIIIFAWFDTALFLGLGGWDQGIRQIEPGLMPAWKDMSPWTNVLLAMIPVVVFVLIFTFILRMPDNKREGDPESED